MNYPRSNYLKQLEQFPQVIQIESSNICNAKCIMCPVHTDKMTRKRKIMSDRIFYKIIEDCKNQSNLQEIHLHQNGEPLMMGHLRLTQRIKYVKDNLPNVKVGFWTNGSLLDKRATELILSNEPDFITFSFDGGTKETYEKVRVGLNFEEVVENINYCIEYKNKNKLKTKLSVIMLAQKDNEDSVNQFHQLWANKDINAGCAGLNNYGGYIDNISILHKFQNKVGKKDTPCWRLWSNLVVGADGFCCLCCCDFNCDVCIGDVLESSIKDIWQGTAAKNTMMREVRRLHTEKRQDKISLCKNCDFMEWLEIKPDWWINE